jgi:RES domain-containing protein
VYDEDLTDPSVQTRLGVPRAQLFDAWRPYQLRGEEAPTQQLGRLIRGTGRFEALVAPSEKHREGRTLVVFPDLVHPPSKLSLVDPDGLWSEQLP